MCKKPVTRWQTRKRRYRTKTRWFHIFQVCLTSLYSRECSFCENTTDARQLSKILKMSFGFFRGKTRFLLLSWITSIHSLDTTDNATKRKIEEKQYITNAFSFQLLECSYSVCDIYSTETSWHRACMTWRLVRSALSLVLFNVCTEQVRTNMYGRANNDDKEKAQLCASCSVPSYTTKIA